MSTTTTKREGREIVCPGRCCGVTTCGETVLAYGFEDFGATTVEVDPCSKLLEAGWSGPQLVELKSRADYLLPPATTTVWQHRDGLVTFAGAP